MEDTAKIWKLRFPEWTPEWVKLCFRIGYRLSLIFLVIFILVAIFYWILASRYDLDKVAMQTEGYYTYYDDGQEITTARNQTRLITPDDLTPLTIQALLAREDTNFYKHWGVDVKGLVRATARNLATFSYKEGASTISMQLVKNTYDNKSKSIHRKLLEIAITYRMERRYEKKDILTHYLNRIYFGAGCHGIEEAAQTYFGVTTKDLTLGQSAMLMGIIRGPHIFSPFNPNNGLNNAIAQRDQVLDRMHKLKYIDIEQCTKAKLAPLNLVPKAERSKKNNFANYAIRSVQRHRQQIIDSKEIIDAGLKIHTTINRSLLNKVTLDLKQVLPPDPSDTPLQAASVILENKTGAIKALVGGRSFLKSSYNRALDSKQELGPAFYPFLYLAAYERGNIPLRDEPLVTGRQVGHETMLKFSTRFGITHKPAKNANDLYRGNIYASPLQLASAYSVFKSEGKRIESYFIKNIQDGNAKELFKNELYEHPVAKAGNAASVFNMISQRKKTAVFTAYAYKHAWVIAISDKYTAVTWIGYDSPRNIPNKAELCKKLEAKMKAWVSGE